MIFSHMLFHVNLHLNSCASSGPLIYTLSCYQTVKIDMLLLAFFLFFYCSILQPIPGFQLMHTNMKQWKDRGIKKRINWRKRNTILQFIKTGVFTFNFIPKKKKAANVLVPYSLSLCSLFVFSPWDSLVQLCFQFKCVCWFKKKKTISVMLGKGDH